MSIAKDISACPFCGSLGVALIGSFVRCGSCGAVGPYGFTDAEAIQRWNERVAAAQMQSDHVATRPVEGTTDPDEP